MRRLVVGLATLLVFGPAASIAAPARTMSIFFLRGEQLASVQRQGPGSRLPFAS